VRSIALADQVTGELDRLLKATSARGDDDEVFADPLWGPALEARDPRAIPGGPHGCNDLTIRAASTTRRARSARRWPTRGVPLRALPEWMGNRDLRASMRYRDSAPSAREAGFIAAAFPIRATELAVNLSESHVISENVAGRIRPCSP
jgi:hypothetical protein